MRRRRQDGTWRPRGSGRMVARLQILAITALFAGTVVYMSESCGPDPVPAAHGADASRASLPAGLNRVSVIERVYPRLYRNELARKGGVSWNRLRRAARTAWMRSHPCSDATLNRRYTLGASSWSIVEAAWRCAGMSESWISVRRCLADHEGGRVYPDVRFGGGRGYPGVPGAARNVVFGHMQGRPGWYRGAYEGRPGTYADDYWTPDLYRWAVHPVNQARAMAPVGTDQYATEGMCT